MDSFWTLYWITRLDTIIFTMNVFAWIFVGSTFLFTLSALIIAGEMDDEETATKAAKVAKASALLFVIIMGVKMFIPSKEDAVVIAAGVGITEAVKSETAQRLASKSVGVIEQWLDKQAKADDNEQTKQEEKRQ